MVLFFTFQWLTCVRNKLFMLQIILLAYSASALPGLLELLFYFEGCTLPRVHELHLC